MLALASRMWYVDGKARHDYLYTSSIYMYRQDHYTAQEPFLSLLLPMLRTRGVTTCTLMLCFLRVL